MAELYTAKQVSKVYREQRFYRVMSVSDEYLWIQYGMQCRTSLTNPDDKKCSLCPALLCGMEDDEYWVMDEDWRLWCARCRYVRPPVTYIRPDFTAKLPVTLSDIIGSIRQHSDFLKLNQATRGRVLGAQKIAIAGHVTGKNTDHGPPPIDERERVTKEMTRLWKFIYWSQEPSDAERQRRFDDSSK